MKPTPPIESTGLSSEEIQRLIIANANEQQAVLDDTERDKATRIAKLREQQKQLYAQRDAARNAERGQAPRERVGVRAEVREVDVWTTVLKEVS